MTGLGFRYAAALPGLGLFCLALLTGEAMAHASDRGHILLLPTGYYLVGGAVAVAASFLALVFLPPHGVSRFAGRRLALGGMPVRGRTAVSLLSFCVFCVLIAAGMLGSRDPLSNPLPLVVWTVFWIGLTMVQGLIGDVWAWINPWYGPWRLMSRLPGSALSLRLPPRAGYWPAILQFLGFAWFELVYPAPDDPARLALVVAAYFLVNFIAMLGFGFEKWSRRGECLSAFLGMVARFSVVSTESDPSNRTRISLGWPGAKLADAPPLPLSGALFLLLVLSSVSFDGLSRTFFWLGLNDINPLEHPGRTAVMTLNTIGLVATFVVLSSVFLGSVRLGGWLGHGTPPWREASGLLVWSIVPIALAYHFSHYLVAFAVNGQYALVALSDPFGRGWNLFGTAGLQVAPGVIAGSESARTIWNLQAAAIIGGHVLAVLAAHLLAYRLYGRSAAAAVSQLPLTVLMIAYTVFGLWLLSTPTAG